MVPKYVAPLLIVTLLGQLVSCDSTLFNGIQGTIFPIGTSQACLDAFDTVLPCDPSLPLLHKQTDWVGWNATNLTTLCTSECRSSLISLQKKATFACGSMSFRLSGTTMNASSVINFYMYKYDLACLSDSGSWCLLEQDSWYLQYLSTVTWPTYTNKTYPDWSYDPIDGTNELDEDGNVIPPYNTVPQPQPTFHSGQKSALDYVYTGRNAPVGDLGSNQTLEYDEYPLEIQCSKCFLDRFKLGFASRWGELYE